ncbi:hypothetical protein TIFTF001_044103 [Ficus carica]|uniref:Uncharacterized protein n=1 Tax=Ficus carica TaxID=3494 RepID=A0AA87ZGY8_FICCA|nr:hypothetical protein TIFTF001_044103 [Ficus carica]
MRSLRGWEAKTVWVANGMFIKNLFILLDTKCGQGIEAWVTLEEKQMAKFDEDEELLAFASINPSAIVCLVGGRDGGMERVEGREVEGDDKSFVWSEGGVKGEER